MITENSDAFARLEAGVESLLAKAAKSANLLPAAPNTEVVVRRGYEARVEADPDAISLRDLNDADLANLYSRTQRDQPREIMNSLRAVAADQATRATQTEKSAAAAVAQIATQVVGPSVSFKASQPDVLSEKARVALADGLAKLYPWVLKCTVGVAIAMGVAAIVVALVAKQPVDLTGAAIAVAALSLVGMTALVIHYFVVMGFKSVEYSGGVSGTKPPEGDPEEEEEGEGEGEQEEEEGEVEEGDGAANLRNRGQDSQQPRRNA